MTSAGLESDFTGCDTAALNRFFGGYLASHSQGGTNTKRRNLRHLFSWLATEYGHPHPYTDGLVRYAPVKVRPSTLAADFVRDRSRRPRQSWCTYGRGSHTGKLRPPRRCGWGLATAGRPSGPARHRGQAAARRDVLKWTVT
jgi:hypothetical protein